jgi:hypothetical protein
MAEVNGTALVALVAEMQARLAAMEERQVASSEDTSAALDASWVFSSGIWVLMMQLGFAMFEAGAVRERNVIATYAKKRLGLLLRDHCGCSLGLQSRLPE